jgi:CRP/FNR family transcriptional regulator, dissimilatory nitrate respiration regulator
MNALSDRKLARDPRLIEGVLGNLPLMKGVGRAVVRQLSTQSALVNAKRGEVVVRRGERVRGVYAIAYGTIKKRLRHPNGAERVLALLGPGDTFAEVPALLDCPAKMEAVALADSMFVVISASCISAQTVSDPRLARNVARGLARRMHALHGELERGILPGVQRIAAYLASIAEPGPGPGSWLARLPVSKTLVAAQLDMKKETLSRLLRRLAAEGIIEVTRRDIAILERNLLDRLACLAPEPLVQV